MKCDSEPGQDTIGKDKHNYTNTLRVELYMYCLNLTYSLVHVIVKDVVHYFKTFWYWFIKFWNFNFFHSGNPHY